MAKPPKNTIIACPFCVEPLDVGDEKRAVVAHCFKTQKSCAVKQWASAATRFNYGEVRDGDGKVGYTHIIQTSPPLTEDEEAAQAKAA